MAWWSSQGVEGRGPGAVEGVAVEGAAAAGGAEGEGEGAWGLEGLARPWEGAELV